MALTKLQATLFEKARAQGAGDQGISLSDSAVKGLIAVCCQDLGLSLPGGIKFSEERGYFEIPPEELRGGGGADARAAFISYVETGPQDSDMYFFSLASLHRARLKFANILRLQPTPTLEQVGPRGLLQFGGLSSRALGTLLVLRKWLFDIDNRAAQETGYLFEPVIAGAIGGVPQSAGSSPVKRNGTGAGRQVDCLRDTRAYEIKLRVTIAASGQGRWSEELAFPADCEASGYEPILIVFDGTANPKLNELQQAFEDHAGKAFVGSDAWAHLEDEAGPTMATFLESYIRLPLGELIAETRSDLPELRLHLDPEFVTLMIGDEVMKTQRTGLEPHQSNTIPDDVAQVFPGLNA